MRVNIKAVLIGVLLSLAVIGALFLPRRDLRSLAQVAGIALDLEDEKIVATFELYVPAVDRPIGTERKVVYGTGETFEECVNSVKKRFGAELYLNDALVLILGSEQLNNEVCSYYSVFAHDHMDLPIFYSYRQKASEIFEGEGAVISTELAASAEKLQDFQTIRDLMNDEGTRVWVRGRGAYEIVL